MLHDIAPSRVASKLRFGSVISRIFSVITLFILILWMPSSIPAQCVTDGLALGDQDLRLPEVSDDLLRGITLSGHGDPFLMTQF